MTLEIDIRHRLGALQLEASFASRGRLTALFGPSGSGKTSVINIIAGLIRPDAGRIVAGDRVLVDIGAGKYLPAHKRRIGFVFQDARLFPHLSVRSNLVYGRWFTPRGERYANFDRVVEMLGIGHLLDRRPNLLSGGERQRVAIGRALLASPRLLLMDEPLASLDDARKSEIMPYLERLRDETKIPIVYVSHSIAEVARLATDIVVMANGKITAAGPTTDIMQRLELLPPEEVGEGGAVLDMTVTGHDAAYAMSVLGAAAGEIRVPDTALAIGAKVRVRIRARDVMIATERPTGLSALNILPGRIAEIVEVNAAQVDIRLDCHGDKLVSRITRQSFEALHLALGREVFAVIKTVAFDRANLSPGASLVLTS
ncbi:molybdenum ABC transporter ATP-binding protein [Aminobacter sp. HY435]|uniref:molybdenum ABC transporter ATP-binding protein n=1 Tax=Aminobacter sp. HY435 TaxID=2970917 RepID=UPI0022B94DA3|nr:molybdenum ABC transporter ATP-binding protein [Aminobacter sp. HY435]